jgi:hypothetical protein
MCNSFGSSFSRIPVKDGTSLEYREKATHDYLNITDQRGLMPESLKISNRLLFFRRQANPVLATVSLDLPFGDRVLGPREGIENRT